MIRWLVYYRLRFLPVLTKTDKLSGNQLLVRQRRISERLEIPEGETPIVFSAKTGAGKDLLWREIRAATAPETGVDRRSLPGPG
jgi:GTP-binding protein